jgi:molybdopterin-guanine dinucleotide biosynthesis protein A
MTNPPGGGKIAVSAAVLVGGQSRRMGKDKAFIEIQGRPMLARVIERLRPLFGEIMIVGSDQAPYAGYGLPVYPDLRPGMGSLGGIHTALSQSSNPQVFCTACDMPFISTEVVAALLRRAGKGHDAVIPMVAGELEPLCAVYARKILPAVEKDLDASVRRIKTTLSSLDVAVVDAEELRPYDHELHTFFNINTPEDLEKAHSRRRP